MSDKLTAYYVIQTRGSAHMEERALVDSLIAIEKKPELRDNILYGSRDQVEYFCRTIPCYADVSGAFYSWWVLNLKYILCEGVDPFIKRMSEAD